MTVTQLLKMDIYSILPWFYLSKIVIFHSKDRENVYHRSPEICRDAGDAASTSFHLISLLRLVVALQRQKKTHGKGNIRFYIMYIMHIMWQISFDSILYIFCGTEDVSQQYLPHNCHIISNQKISGT